MGGKKKTKWRKLPLEEFTKEKSPKQEEKSPTDTCRTDAAREENVFNPSYHGPPELIQNYVEPYEYIDGIWYPTSCVVYNPGLFSNYMMPADNFYYYCTVPEAGQMQEYMPVPYQEYTPVLPKDTIYLLLPTQTFRPAQPVQNIAPEWQNRRRRRRYEGYAEYAVIPERINSSKSEETDQGRFRGTGVNSRRKSIQFNNCRRMSSPSETSFSNGLTSEQNHVFGKTNETKENPINVASEKSLNNLNKDASFPGSENNHMSKKNLEMCAVHSKRKGSTNEQQPQKEQINNVSIHDKLHQAVDKSSNFTENSSQPNGLLASRSTSENTENEKKKKEHLDTGDQKDLTTKENSECAGSLGGSNHEKATSAEISSLNQNDDHIQQADSKEKEILDTESQTSVPDSVSSLTKMNAARVLKKLQDEANSCESDLCDNVQMEMDLRLEMEMELQSLKASQTDKSIYKLAYDENVTDQSSNSRSPSPVLSAEQNIPCSYSRNEIIVHEAGSDDDAGSEDVEIIPHRYESESYLNQLKNKNVYVNKLSLAVELLRTHENLPYDDEFKRIVGEKNIQPAVLACCSYNGKKVNLDNRRNSSSPEKSGITNNTTFKNLHYGTKNGNEITSQRQINPSPEHSSDSAIFSDTDFNNFENDSCESAKETVCQLNEEQDITNEVRVGYRRIGVAQRQLTPLPFNPCFCCIIM